MVYICQHMQIMFVVVVFLIILCCQTHLLAYTECKPTFLSRWYIPGNLLSPGFRMGAVG